MNEIEFDDLTRCAHCQHPFGFGWKAQSLTTVLMYATGAESAYHLCTLCHIELGEFLAPMLKENETWKTQTALLKKRFRAAEN